MQLPQNAASAPFRIMRGRVNSQSLPPTVRENVERHIRNLTRLAEGLKSLGMDQREIDDHVIEIFEQYRSALLDNVERMKCADAEMSEMCCDSGTRPQEHQLGGEDETSA